MTDSGRCAGHLSSRLKFEIQPNFSLPDNYPLITKREMISDGIYQFQPPLFNHKAIISKYYPTNS